MADESNYAMTDGAFLVSAKRFAQSPWLAQYRTDSMVLWCIQQPVLPAVVG